MSAPSEPCPCVDLNKRDRARLVEAFRQKDIHISVLLDRGSHARWINGDEPIPLYSGDRLVASGTMNAMHAANRLLRCDPLTPIRREYPE